MGIRRLSRSDLGAILFLLAATVLFHWPLITPDLAHRHSYPEGDFYDQFHAFATYEHHRLWASEIPLWNPYNFGGHPFLADVQAAVFYPPSLLTMLVSGPGSFSPLWLELEAMAHYYLAALFTYLFVRRLLVVHVVSSSAGASFLVVGPLVSALTFAFGGYLTGYPSQQLAILETQVWLPLILLLLDIGLSAQRVPFVLGAGLAWGVALLAGHPQSAMYVFYAVLLYGLFRSWQIKLAWRWVALAQLAWIGIGLGLAAVHLLPAWEFMRLSVRSSLTYGELAGGFAVRDLAQYLIPGAFTHWSPMYVGIYPLFLAAMGCAGEWQRGRRSSVLFWLTLALISLVLSLGGKALLYRLFYWVVPGFNLFRSQERAIYLTSFALAVLAGYGGHWLSTMSIEAAPVRWGALGMLALGVASAAATIVVWAMGRGKPEFDLSAWLARLSLWAGLTWAGWGLARWVPRGRPWWAFLTLALVMVDLGLVNMPRNLVPGRAESRVYDGAWLGSVLDDDSLLRIANEWGLPGNVGCWLHLQDLYGASPLRLQAHKTMADTLPHWRLWQLFGVRYVATWEHDCPGPFPWQQTAMHGKEWEKNTVYVHRLAIDLPRAWVVHSAHAVDGKSALALLADPTFDPFEQVLLSDDIPPGFSSNVATYPAEVIVLDYAPEKIVVQADLSVQGWLILGEWDYPGWRAWVDGKWQEIYRADYGLRAVPLRAGVHRVEFYYRPMSVYVGAAMSVLAWTLLACVLLLNALFSGGKLRRQGAGR